MNTQAIRTKILSMTTDLNGYMTVLDPDMPRLQALYKLEELQDKIIYYRKELHRFLDGRITPKMEKEVYLLFDTMDLVEEALDNYDQYTELNAF